MRQIDTYAKKIFVSKESSQPIVPYYLWPRTINHAPDPSGSSRFLSRDDSKKETDLKTAEAKAMFREILFKKDYSRLFLYAAV